MEPLAAILRSMRLSSAMLSRAVLTGRWGVSTRGASAPIFHGVVEGRALARRVGDRATASLEAGDMVVFPRGCAHELLSDEQAVAAPITSLSGAQTGSIRTLSHGSPGATTRLLCGLFLLDHPVAAGLVELLPEMMVVRPEDSARKAWARSTLELLDGEVQRPGASADVISLADSLFVHVLSASASANLEPSSLLAAARDEQIGRALALIHGSPDRAWTAATLAARVGMSRSRFFERFTELVGEPPARYITRWKIHTAADLMRQQAISNAEIAERVGYASEESLAKVFKRYLGVSPSNYRRAQRGEGEGLRQVAS